MDDDDEGDRPGKISELESKFQQELAQERGAAPAEPAGGALPTSGSKKRSKAEVEEERARMMMPKKDRRLYDKIKFGQGRKSARVSELEVRICCCGSLVDVDVDVAVEIDSAAGRVPSFWRCRSRTHTYTRTHAHVCAHTQRSRLRCVLVACALRLVARPSLTCMRLVFLQNKANAAKKSAKPQ